MNMKNFFWMSLLASTIVAPGAACGGRGNSSADGAQPGSKTLVAYFSASGVTRGVAQTLAQATGGDLFEIAPAVRYSDADLDWRDTASRSTVEMKDPASRVAIAARVEDMSRYDTLFVGFPIWWYTAPHIIESFLESYDLAGKVIIPFATSGGSPMGHTVSDLRPSAPAAQWQEGKVLNGRQRRRRSPSG